MRSNNLIVEKSKNFAIQIIHLYQKLISTKKEFILSKQILRSGTSIGANVKESIYAQSKADFISKMSIALKESSETEYWLELLHETNYISQENFTSLYEANKEILKILTKIINTSKKVNC